MDLNDVLRNEAAWERSGQSNAERLSERHIEMMTVLIVIRDELRALNYRQYEELCARENAPRHYEDV